MSHLLSNSVHRPYLFDLPRPAQPITPPETDNEFVGSTPTAVPPRGPLDSETHASYPSYASLAPAEPFDPLHRKVPSISYVNSSLRESRERVVQRSYKWLVVVIPPPSFSREHGHLGHTLSSGPPDRLSQGLLMPLYPTMNSQLTAIAREFNLPSITGLCVYLRTNQNGLALNPRISDESWSLLWSHLFDARSPTIPLMQMPISGQIEFDIDIAKARWYDVWLGIARRDAVDVPRSVAPSRISHGRGGDSRTSFLDDHGEDQLDNISLFQQTRTPFIAPRLVPKKLSLLDRLDSASARSAPRAVPRQLSPNSPNEDVQMSRMLSPIVQEEEPKTARRDIDKMVNSWRASASISRSPLAATGQTSLDPANLPNTLNDLPIPSPVDDVFEMNLDDYTWSISSAGPPDYDPADDEFISWVYSPSVHLDRRLQGSVLLTPSSHTSFGPPDDDYDYLSVSYSSRLPSPDIAMRLLEDAPPTPSTATSWGAPSYYPPSPSQSSDHRAPSVDIALRQMHSRPVTPGTATSWGAPSEYPPSPMESSFGRAPSVDIALRHMHSRPVTPATATSWGAPSSYPPSPVSNEFAYRVPSPDIALRGMSSVPHSPLPMIWRKRASTSSQPWNHVWPYNAERDVSEFSQTPEPAASPSRFVFPYYSGAPSETGHIAQDISASLVVARPSGFAFPYYRPGQNGSSFSREASFVSASPSHFGFPYYEPSHDTTTKVGQEPVVSREVVASPSTLVFPYYSPTRSASLVHQQVGQEQAVSQEIVASPSTLVFPYYSASRSAAVAHQQSSGSLDTTRSARPALGVASASYPHFNLYPAVYPFFDLYPATVRLAGSDMGQVSTHLDGAYPVFSIYPAAYPHLEIYPGHVTRFVASADRAVPGIPITLRPAYPTFRLYPAVYPDSLQEIYPPIATSDVAGSTVVGLQLPEFYPSITLYAPVYPHNLYGIYPPSSGSSSRWSSSSQISMDIRKDTLASKGTSISVGLSTSYPTFNLYPKVYPYSLEDIYPSFSTRGAEAAVVSIQLSITYPNFDLYPAVYPNNVARIYPSVIGRDGAHPTRVDGKSVAVGLSVQRLTVGSAPQVYPYSLYNIYPEQQSSSLGKSRVVVPSGLRVKLEKYYPTLEIYANVYPYNVDDIYPAFTRRDLSTAGIIVKLPTEYPGIMLYPPVYPWNVAEIYAPRTAAVVKVDDVEITTTFDWSYPAFKIYPAVYPYSLDEIYPSVVASMRISSMEVVSLQPRAYPFFDLYPAVNHRTLKQMSAPSSYGREASVPGMSPSAGLSIGLSQAYPFICLYPPVYPFFALYPEAVHNSTAKSAESDVGKGQRVPYPAFMIYPSVYPYIVIYPAIWRASEVVEQSRPPAVQAKTVTIQPPVFKARRRPTFSHADLHKQVYPSRRRPKYSHSDLRNQVFAEQSGLLDLMFGLPATSSSATSSPATSSPVTSSPTASLPINPPASTPPRARARSSTVSRPMSVQRPIQTEVKTSPTDSPVRRPFSVMGSPATQSSSNPPSRTPSLRAVGLPSNPAVTRRMSTASVSRPTSSAFAPMPTVEEPDDGLSGGKPLSNSTAPTDYMRDRTSRVPRSLDATRNLSRAGSNSATLPQRASMLGARPELSRSLTMPSSNRGNRLSMVRERAMAYDQSSTIIEGSSVQATETLEPFPGPPRIPLPPLPKAKAVSKLDRSKYPFA